MPEDPQTVPVDRPFAEQDQPTVLRERAPQPGPARAYPDPQPAPTRAYPTPAQPELPAEPRPAAQPDPQPGAAAAPRPATTLRSRIFSDLNLNGPVPARVRPNIGEWGPTGLPSTKQKKRWRWLAPVLFVLALIVVTIVGYIFWRMYR